MLSLSLSLYVILGYVIPDKTKIHELAVIYDIVLKTLKSSDFNS